MSNIVLLVTNMPTPYRTPLFNRINSKLESVGLKLIVVFGVDVESRRSWNIDYSEFEFEYVLLESNGILRKGAETLSLYYSGLFRLVLKTRPQCVITPGFSIATLKMFLTNFLLGTKYIVWTGEINLSSKRKSYNKNFVKKLCAARASKYIAYGALAKTYLTSIGVDAKDIDVAINTVDTKYFSESAIHPREKDNINQFIYIGNLTQGKRVDLLLKAMSKINSLGQDASLIIVGDGPMKDELEQQSRELLLDNVKFLGYRQKQELPQLLNESICMLFPSEYDIWGLVLCEAMASGVPCISSNKSGATHDLINHGVNGYAIDFEDTNILVEKMIWMIKDKPGVLKMSVNAKNFMLNDASIDVSASAFSNSILSILPKYK